MLLRPISTNCGQLAGYSFWCPGCLGLHVFYTAGNVVWAFNGDMEKPTFSPSLLNTCANHTDPARRVCHLNLTDGNLQYHADCTHGYAGKIVALVAPPSAE